MLEERFSIVPEWVLDAAVSDAAVRLYAVLLRFGATSGQRMPSRRTLADRLRKKSVDSVDRALKELVAIGAVEVTRRSRDGLNLTNRYLVRSTRPGRPRSAPRSGGGGRTDAATPGTGGESGASPTTGGTPPGECRHLRGGRRSAARGGRTGAARVAATVRPDRESLTENSPPPPGPSSTDTTVQVSAPDGGPGVTAGRSARRTRVVAALGLADLADVAERCTRLRADFGLPAGLWTADRLADVLAAAVLDAGWPAAAAVPALLAVAADPATRSPARLSCPGPWWDVPPGSARADRPEDRAAGGTAVLEAVLAETGGLRVALQRQARAELSGEGVPLTRSSVTRRAVEILRRSGGITVPGVEMSAERS
ncbi:MAG: hypothetical protein HY830_20030 [Actinobacteria bacterium]|nr:hypothetical protein [Actinomycetota bacterium]